VLLDAGGGDLGIFIACPNHTTGGGGEEVGARFCKVLATRVARWQ